MQEVEWGEFRVGELFGKSTRGRRLKSDDRIAGTLPFVTAGESEEGVSAFIGNDVTIFSANTTTIDMFGSAKYRGYEYGGDDHVAVVHTEKLSAHAAKFVTSALHRAAYTGEFHYGRNFYAKDADNLVIQLPITATGEIDYEFMESFIAELEAERIAELEAYLEAAGLKDCELTAEEETALAEFEGMEWGEFSIIDLFDVKNSRNIISRDIKENSGNTPYLCASAENNSVSSYISYDTSYLDEGNCIFIGGKTFVVTYQENDFYSNDSHNLILRLKDSDQRNKPNQLFLAACVRRSLGRKYSWGDSISNKKIQTDKMTLPAQSTAPDYTFMATFISAIQKLVIKGVVEYADRKIAATRAVAHPVCEPEA